MEYYLVLKRNKLLYSEKTWKRHGRKIKCIFSSVQSLSCVRLFAIPWIAACQASLSIANCQNLLKPMSIKSVMPSSHLILCCPLLLLSPIPPSLRIFSNESALLMRWPKYWSFSFSISPSNEHSGLPITMWSKVSMKELHGMWF